MTTRPGDDLAAASRGRMRSSHADREQAIEVLKAAFAQGRLDKDELDARAGQALAARTTPIWPWPPPIFCRPPQPQPGRRARRPRHAVGRWPGRPSSRASA